MMRTSYNLRFATAMAGALILLGGTASGADLQAAPGDSGIATVPEMSAALLGLIGVSLLVLRRTR